MTNIIALSPGYMQGKVVLKQTKKVMSLYYLVSSNWCRQMTLLKTSNSSDPEPVWTTGS